MFFIWKKYACSVLFSTCVRLSLVKSPEVTLCGWLGYKAPRNQLFFPAQGKYGPFETAIYAVLSGNLTGTLPVCQSWCDCLWAYFRTLVDVKVEQEIRLRSVTFRKPIDLPPQYWDSLYVKREEKTSGLAIYTFFLSHGHIRNGLLL